MSFKPEFSPSGFDDCFHALSNDRGRQQQDYVHTSILLALRSLQWIELRYVCLVSVALNAGTLHFKK